MKHAKPDPTRLILGLALIVAVLLGAVILVVALRPTGPVTILARDITVSPNIAAGKHATLRALLPPSDPRATVPAMSETEQVTYGPGDLVPVAGVYKPVGTLADRDQEQRVATGLRVAHESYFEVGEELPPLTGYRAGAVWVLRP